MSFGTHRWVTAKNLPHVIFKRCKDCRAWMTSSEQGNVQTSGEEVCPADQERRLNYGKAPPGECLTCDKWRDEGVTFHPRHTASSMCKSGRRNHCSCDGCF